MCFVWPQGEMIRAWSLIRSSTEYVWKMSRVAKWPDKSFGAARDIRHSDTGVTLWARSWRESVWCLPLLHEDAHCTLAQRFRPLLVPTDELG